MNGATHFIKEDEKMANISCNVHIYEDEIKANVIDSQGKKTRYINMGDATIFYNDLEKVQENYKRIEKA